MKLILTEEEQFLKDTAKNFAEERSPITHFRSLRDNSDPMLWDKNIWNEMSKLGWPGIMIPEEFGGSNFGHASKLLENRHFVYEYCKSMTKKQKDFIDKVIDVYNLSGNEIQEVKHD